VDFHTVCEFDGLEGIGGAGNHLDDGRNEAGWNGFDNAGVKPVALKAKPDPTPAPPMESNPYATPAADLYGSSGAILQEGSVGVAQTTLHLLQRTKPWARFVGICVMLYGGLVVLVGLAAAIATFAGSGPLEGEDQSQSYRIGFGIGMFLMYGLLGFLIFYPGLKLNSFANRIGDLLRDPAVPRLDAALQQQRVQLKFTGIVIIVVVALLLLVVASALVVRSPH
jgi:hypothetical protein